MHVDRLPLIKTSPLIAAIALLLAPAQAQVEFGENRQPIPAPTGYPSSLVYVPKAAVRIGISAQDVIDTAKEFGRNVEGTRFWMKILAREMSSKKHTELVDAFLIGQHEVTNAEYETFVKKMHPNIRFPFSWWKTSSIDKAREAYYKETKRSLKPIEYWKANWRSLTTDWEVPAKLKDLPVTYVTIEDAKRYCAWAGVRLPYEVEWQAALQGPTKKPTRYLWGDKWDSTKSPELLNFDLRDVGTWTKTRSYYGIDDMLGSVWEYTNSPLVPYDGWKSEFPALEKAWRKTLKKGDRHVLPQPHADGRFVVRGGSFTSKGQLQIVARLSTRRPIDSGETVDDIGFRVAKSLRPAFDASTLRAAYDYKNEQLQGFELDLPSRLDQRNGDALRKEYEQRGIERWTTKDGKISAYHMVSFIPVATLGSVDQRKMKTAKDFLTTTAERCKPSQVGAPVAVLMSTESFSVQTGINQRTELQAGNYTISFRGKGMPRELAIALNDGRSILKSHKGERPAKTDKTEPAKDDKKKSSKKKSKKADKEDSKSSDPFPILDRFGIPDEMTMKYPKEKPKVMLVQPGNLEVPIKQNILLWQNETGNYVGWSEYRPSVRATSVRQSKAKLDVDVEKSLLTYKGGPQTSRVGQRFELQIEIKLSEPLGQNVWVTPDTKIEMPDPRQVDPGNISPKPKK